MVKNDYPNVKLIKNDNNMGFSKGVNIGIKKSKGEFIWVLNPDTLVSDDTFITLLDYLNNNQDVGCIGPKILDSDGNLQLACKRSFPWPLNALIP